MRRLPAQAEMAAPCVRRTARLTEAAAKGRAAAPLTLAGVALLAAILGACQSNPTVDDAAQTTNDIARLNTQLGIEYLRDGDPEMALRKFERALKADPNYAEAHNAMGLLHNRLREYDKAEASFRTATRLEPANSNALNNYGQFLCQRGRYAEGEQMFVEAVKNPLYRTPGVAYSNAGTCAMGRGDVERAEAHFREALQADARLSPALLQMAQLNFDRGNHLAARAYLQRFLEVANHDARTLWLGVQIERQLGDKDALASYALQLEKNYPDSKEAGLLQQTATP